MLSIYTNPVFYEHDTGADIRSRPRGLRCGLAASSARGSRIHISRETADHRTPPHHRQSPLDRLERALDQAARSGMRDFFSGDNPMCADLLRGAHRRRRRADAAEEMMSGQENRAFVVARRRSSAPNVFSRWVSASSTPSPVLPNGYAERPGIERVFVFFDFDVHHGNGTQALFWDETTSSTRRCCFPFYPGTGATNEIAGAAAAATR